MAVRFEWDSNKAKANLAKHRLSFETATLIWGDPNRLEVQDRWENDEERWQSIGLARGQVLVLVAHTIKTEGQAEVIRIISARKANGKELNQYEQGR